MRLILLLFCLSFSYAQYTSSAHQKAMERLSFLIGNWKGSAWMMSREGKIDVPVQTETVTWQLDKTAILVEGKGFRENGSVVHHAMGLISWNQEKNHYDFHSVLANGHSGNSIANFNEEGLFQWFLEIPSGKITYTVSFADGSWQESGKMDIQGQERQIMGMKLSRLD